MCYFVTMRLLPSLIALSMLSACRGCSEERELEVDPAIAGILDAVAVGPEAAADHLNAIADPMERQMALAYLLQEAPQAAEPICPFIEERSLQQTCMERASRAHLWQKPDALTVSEGQGAKGPRTHQLNVGDDLSDPYLKLKGDPGDCTEPTTQAGCLTHAASEAAADNDPDTAASLCAVLDTGQHRSECFFLASEALFEDSELDHVSAASDLCLAAGTFQSRCFAHLIMSGTQGVKPADRPSTSDPIWLERAAFAEEVADWWAEHDEATAEIALQRFWSNATMQAFARAETVTGDLMDVVPPEHQGHVRAAAAWRLLQLESLDAHDLDGWVQTLEQALEERTEDAGDKPQKPRSRGVPKGVPNMWDTSVAGPTELTAAIYLTTSRRVVSDTPAIDGAICILEAAARSKDEARASLLAEGAASSNLALAWTAQRLQGGMSGTPKSGGTPPTQQATQPDRSPPQGVGTPLQGDARPGVGQPKRPMNNSSQRQQQLQRPQQPQQQRR